MNNGVLLALLIRLESHALQHLLVRSREYHERHEDEELRAHLVWRFLLEPVGVEESTDSSIHTQGPP